MKKNISNNRTARISAQKEEKAEFGFCIGIDLGDKHSDVCVLDSHGEICERFRLKMKGPYWQAYFTSIPRSRVALEAGGQSRWVAELVEQCGHEVLVSNTRKVPYIHESDNKHIQAMRTSWPSCSILSRVYCIRFSTAANRRNRT
jgi:hypothetical protein